MFKTLRTSYGFGVHSPFAFDFITKVLREKDRYYPYPEAMEILDNEGLLTARNIRFANLIMRISFRYKPSVIELAGTNARLFEGIRKLTIDNLGAERTTGRIFFLSGEDIKAVDLKTYPEQLFCSRKIIIADMYRLTPETISFIEKLREDAESGMTFTSTNGIKVYVFDDNLPIQNFKLIF